jgi:glycolate oxidase FAD binding subunit
MDNACIIDGFGPLPLLRVQACADLSEVVRQAAAEKSALYPIGGQTALDLGMLPSTLGKALDLRGLAKIIDFPARDMTITVETGVTLAQLRDILVKENLRLPIDVPQADRATLGGAIATNASGSRRLGFGTLRDYVIGIGAINDAGQEFKAGGRVVKNVAGYDLCKLLVGSLGTLGIITQVTLKLRPCAEEQALVILPCADSDLATTLDKLHASRTRPVCLDLLNGMAAEQAFGQAHIQNPGSSWTIVVGFEGNDAAVQWQVQQLIREIGGSLEARMGTTAEPLWQALTEWPVPSESGVCFKANLVPSAVAGFCQKVARDGDRVALRAHAGSGIVVGEIAAKDGQAGGLTCDGVAAVLSRWRELAREGKGSVVVTRCPPAWKKSLSVWGPEPAAAWLMREIKKKFDPGNLFNPGRFVAGI